MLRESYQGGEISSSGEAPLSCPLAKPFIAALAGRAGLLELETAEEWGYDAVDDLDVINN